MTAFGREHEKVLRHENLCESRPTEIARLREDSLTHRRGGEKDFAFAMQEIDTQVPAASSSYAYRQRWSAVRPLSQKELELVNELDRIDFPQAREFLQVPRVNRAIQFPRILGGDLLIRLTPRASKLRIPKFQLDETHQRIDPVVALVNSFVTERTGSQDLAALWWLTQDDSLPRNLSPLQAVRTENRQFQAAVLRRSFSLLAPPPGSNPKAASPPPSPSTEAGPRSLVIPHNHPDLRGTFLPSNADPPIARYAGIIVRSINIWCAQRSMQLDARRSLPAMKRGLDEFAALTGISPANVNRIRNGRRWVDGPELFTLLEHGVIPPVIFEPTLFAHVSRR